MDAVIDATLWMSVERRGGPHSRNQCCGNSSLESRALRFSPVRVTWQFERTYSVRFRLNRGTSMFNADEQCPQDMTRAQSSARRPPEKLDEIEERLLRCWGQHEFAFDERQGTQFRSS